MRVIQYDILLTIKNLKGDQSDIYIKEFINDQLGGWSMLNDKDNNLTPFDLINRISKYKALTFMPVYVGANPKNTKLNMIKVSFYLTFF